MLRELHAWDPFNVTEDADLGIRLGQKGYRVGIVEFDDLRGGELPRRQLDPPALALDQGLHADAAGPHAAAAASHPHARACSAFSASSSSSAAPCCRACSIRSSGRSISSGWSRIGRGFDPLFPQILLFLSLFNLLAGNGAFIYLSMLAPIQRGWLDLIPYSLTVFGYWVLMSIAAYKALWQLLRNPFFWEKTQHGVSPVQRRRIRARRLRRDACCPPPRRSLHSHSCWR